MAVIGGSMASVLLLVSATWLPWATYRSMTLSVIYRGGNVGQVLVFCSAAWLVLTIGSAVRHRATVYWLQFSIAIAAVVVSGVLTLKRIAEANGTAGTRLGHGRSAATVYGLGAELAVVASVVMIVCSVTQLGQSRAKERASATVAYEPERIR